MLLMGLSLCMVLQNEWVICRVFRKNYGGKKTHVSAMMKFEVESTGNGLDSSVILITTSYRFCSCHL